MSFKRSFTWNQRNDVFVIHWMKHFTVKCYDKVEIIFYQNVNFDIHQSQICDVVSFQPFWNTSFGEDVWWVIYKIHVYLSLNKWQTFRLSLNEINDESQPIFPGTSSNLLCRASLGSVCRKNVKMKFASTPAADTAVNRPEICCAICRAALDLASFSTASVTLVASEAFFQTSALYFW